MAEASADERIRTFLTVMPRLLKAERPPAAALQDIAEVARTLFDARYAGAVLIEDDGSFGAVSFTGMPSDTVKALRADPDAFGLFSQARSGAVRRSCTDDASPHLEVPAAHPQVQHLLAAPLTADRHVVGVLYVADREDGRPFSETDQHLAHTAGGLLGAALSNARLLRDALHARSWMRAATGITQELFAGELKQPLQQIADRVHELADADFVGLAVLEDDSLVVRHATGPELDPLVVGKQLPLQRTTLAERTIRSGRGQVVGALDPGARESLRSWTGIEVGPAMMLPLRGADGVLGVMFVGRAMGAWRFTETDVEIAGSFANHAAVAVELANARLVAEQLQVLEERNRIGRDLHDHIVQRLFGTGMSLQRVLTELEGPARERVSGAITTLDDTIRQIRNTIMSLRNPEEEATLESLVADIAREATPLLGFRPQLVLDGPAGDLAGPLAGELAACVREGMSNIVRHANAGHVEVHATTDGSSLVLSLRDNGVGIQSSRRSGLDNMAARVRRYGGSLDVSSAPGEGTQLSWRVPIPRGTVPLPRRPGR